MNNRGKGNQKYLITYNGETKNINEWATKIGISWAALKLRLDYGWSIEEALTLPAGAYRPRKKTKPDFKKLEIFWAG